MSTIPISDSPVLLRRAHLLAIVGGVWLLYGLFVSVQWYFVVLPTRNRVELSESFTSNMIGAAVSALGTLYVVWFSRRWRVERGNWRSRLAAHLANCALFAVVMVFIHVMIEVLVFREGSPWGDVLRLMLLFSDKEINTYWAVVFITHTHDYYLLFRDSTLRASRLETEVANARYDLLKAQIHPHFLFNTLNTITAVIHEDTKAAKQMVAALGRFLRATLATNEPEASLRQELQLLDSYLAIQLVRFSGRLQVGIDVPAELLDARVPTLLLQSFVENAIKHGISHTSAPGRVSVRARREDDTLVIEVTDSGHGVRTAHAAQGLGLGLANARSRLQYLYGRDQQLTIQQSGSGSGSVVRLRIPFREGEPHAP